MGRRLSLVTGAAIAAGLAIVLVANFVPSSQLASPLALIIVSGVWPRSAFGLF